MKRLILGIAITSALGLTACSEDSFNKAKNNAETLVPVSQLVFDPAAGEVPLPNDLLFNGTTDGTLSIPGEDGTDYINPQYALGALDGWSTTSPISITIELAQNNGVPLTLDATSVAQPGAIRMFEATTGGALSSDPECAAELSVSACKVGAELQYGVDFVTQGAGETLAIIPLKPLKPNQSYIYATTRLIEDSLGRAIEPSSTYGLLKLDIETKPLETPDQLFLQGLVNSYEKGLAAAHGVDAETLTYTGLFTTQSVADVYETSKLLMAADPRYTPSFTQVPTPMSNGAGGIVTVAQMAQLTSADGLAYVVSDLADVYTAKINLPIYGDCSSAQCVIPIIDGVPSAPNGRWMARGDSPISVLSALQAGTLSNASFAAQAIAQGIDPQAAMTNPALLAGYEWMLEDGTAADKTKHLTKFNPIAKVSHWEEVNVLITLPNLAKVQAFTSANNLPFSLPTAGWPTTIAMHGLGGGKEMSLAYAGMYAAAGVATVSIDMPLHGERSFDANGDGIYDMSATSPEFAASIGKAAEFATGNPLVFVNVSSTLTVRDNFRQATLDHLGLRLLLTGLASNLAAAGETPVFDANNVSIQGLSLGGIVGSMATNYANTGLINPQTGEALPNAYAVNAASLVAPSGGLAGSFVGSETFGPVLYSTVLASSSFQALVDEANTQNYQQGSAEYTALVNAVYESFIPTFAFAVQTAIDSADPINHAASLAQSQTPIHLIEVVGDETNLGDQVLPNRVDSFPLSGTEPFITALGLDCVATTTAGSGAVRFAKGHHSSLVSPSEIPNVTDGMAAYATAEMQQQVTGFAQSAASGMASIVVTNPGVLASCD
ncbi:VolA/Pla-1 family phospholipase [Shewanella intestini]|uniref:Lipase n=1 Tax=Shewanella intestini TaxID=2017544 RepID=A0ABS5I5E8_9GAMM|nr:MULTISPECIES: VolA/Pla-1 family phospholipase [Shewanella]MBR9729255.1 lipase [Shewanella intestini]MRG35400.1 lipase [Shewanella sp. XMDDZSB0408]